MSQNNNQSRNHPGQYRITGRFNSSNRSGQFLNNALNKGDVGNGGGSMSTSSNVLNHSLNNMMYNGNGQRQPRPNSPNAMNISSSTLVVHNGSPRQQPPNKLPDASSTAMSGNVMPTVGRHKSFVAAENIVVSPNIQSTSQPSNASSNSEIKAPTRPTKENAVGSFSLQFGSMSPTLMQIPARTSSAPPNLDEQKKAEVKVASTMPLPSIPKQPLPKKDSLIPDRTNIHGPSKSKRESQVAPVQIQTQDVVVQHPTPTIHMQLPYHQFNVPIQFTPTILATSFQPMPMPMPIPMPLSMSGPIMQQPLYVSGLLPHPMQPQVGHGLSFTSQMRPHIAPHLSNMGVGMGRQFSPQQAGKYSASRKPVKITHPETHEELRLLDSSTVEKSHPNVALPQQQPNASLPNHPLNTLPPLSPPASPVTLNGATHVPPTSQPPLSYIQVECSSPKSAPVLVPSPRDVANETINNSSLKDNVLSDTNEAKTAVPKGNKKKKHLYKKAEEAGTSSDLYNAYKGPEETKEVVADNTLSVTPTITDNTVSVSKPVQSKVEPDDWEDAEVLEISSNDRGEDDKKRYSRDFLLKFAGKFNDLPDGFEATSDIADCLTVFGVNVTRDPSPGRNNERPMSGRGDMYRYTTNVGLRPGKDGVQGNPRPLQYSGGILTGPNQSYVQRSNLDSDRWQSGGNFQKGLLPSPQGRMIHRAEKKYEVGKVTDEEQVKQRQLKGILNKLTPQNFEKLFQQVKEVNIDNVVTLSGVISQIFDKALMEPTFCEMYANFCSRIAQYLPDLSIDGEKITFKILLLNKCQEEFERGEREEAETAQEREEKRLQTRRRMLGNIRLVGELYKKRMLTERIMHSCISKLLDHTDEENIEALCKLMSTIGEMIDQPRAKEHLDYYFSVMFGLSNNMELSSRIRFMLKDAIDLRKNNWQQRRKVEGPKKIDEVHRDAAKERHAQSTRLAREPSFSGSARRTPPVPSLLGSFRPFPLLGYNNSQDRRIEERQSLENWAKFVPLTQRPVIDDSIALRPQARGMTLTGPNVYSSGQGRFAASPMSEQLHSQDRRAISVQCASSQNVLTEEQLRAKSMAAIKEYYSARDEKEVALCIKDLNCPSYYPSMVSLWVTDSFERKDIDRDALTKLLISLTKPGDAMILSKDQLIKGFESVLAVLEDAENDAPRASEFLGRIFAQVILEKIISLPEIGRLLSEGGQEPGQLVQAGIEAKVLGTIKEIIKSQQGDSVLNQQLPSLWF